MHQNRLSQWQSEGKYFYVSITGLRPKGIFAALFFWRHAIPSKIQAEKATGVLFVGVKTINGIHHTLTAWESKEAMQKYIYSGSHKLAIRVFRKIATGKTFGYVSRTLPDWDQVHALWTKQGIEYGV
jgi:hypothetical protein